MLPVRDSGQSLVYHTLQVVLHVFVQQLFYLLLYLLVVSLHWKTELFELPVRVLGSVNYDCVYISSLRLLV